MKLGVLTVGSDAPGLNAVIRAVVRTAVHRYQADVFGISHGFEGLLRPPEYWPLSPADVQGLVRRGGTILGCNRGNPFVLEGEDRSDEILESVRWLGIDGLICIGGEGSLVIANQLYKKGVPVVCIPKTVENDLPGTGVTFGYSTAVELATSAIDVLQTTGETTYQVMYLEVSGQRAGWIALTSGMAGGADVILIPEIPYRAERIQAVIEERKAAGKKSTIVVVAEGARAADEAKSEWARPADDARAEPAPGAPGDLRGTHDSVAGRVAAEMARRTGIDDYRVTVLGHLQRGGDPNPHDRVLATRFGAAAVRAANYGQFGKLVAVQGAETVLVPLEDVVGSVRTIEPSSELVWTAASLGISLGEDLLAPVAAT